MGGKSSRNGASFANRASRDLVGTGSMTSRSPSFRMMASSPGNSNSRGMRTALFRPFLKTLTWRSRPVLARLIGICQAYAKEVSLSSPREENQPPRKPVCQSRAGAADSCQLCRSACIVVRCKCPPAEGCVPRGAIPKASWLGLTETAPADSWHYLHRYHL